MDYIKVSFELAPVLPAREILYAELGELPFESFEETDNGIEAYIPAPSFKEEMLKDLMIERLPNQGVKIATETIEQQNWNAVWESNFEPIVVNDRCVIRAPFHEKTAVDYEVIISPQMSFGTGHHETTFLISNELFHLNLKNKSLLDMGCGTGVLAIIGHLLGAHPIEAIDIEEWAYENTKENNTLNKVEGMTVLHGDAALLENKNFDVILANINRNILLNDMTTYANCLNKGGKILFSGFYETDVPTIKASAEENGLIFEKIEVKNNWAMALFTK
ncbi:MAG: 50S ribosomal protein L11 methyltransferase [Flavobacteriales bacterium]|jgi:ribosomal protein L11 methyltransferase|nr:50S ribosomal protein L11 methyltransferase [Flavobacteriales bacterium]